MKDDVRLFQHRSQKIRIAYITSYQFSVVRQVRGTATLGMHLWRQVVQCPHFVPGSEQAVREMFNMSATRYYQVLNALIDRPDALAFDPMLVKRLRRMRAARTRARSARRLGIQV